MIRCFLFYFLFCLNLGSFPLIANAEISHPFQACQNEIEKSKLMCTRGSAKAGLENLKQAANDLNKFSAEHVFKEEMKARVAAFIDLQIKKNQSLSDCFRQGQAPYCNTAKTKIQTLIHDEFSDMKIALALSSPRFQEDRILDDPATRYNAKPKHLISEMTHDLNLHPDEIRKTEQIYREQVADKKLNLSRRREFQDKMKTQYFDSLVNNPILGYVRNSNPTDPEISEGFTAIQKRLIQFQKEVFKKGPRGQDQTDWEGVFQFHGVAEEILKENPNLCDGALSAWNSYALGERLSRAGQVLVAFGAGFSCLVSTPICLIAGLGVGVHGATQADQRFENEVASSFVQPELADYARLSDAEKAAWVEKVMLPTVFLGAGSRMTSAFRAAKSTIPTSAVESALLKSGLSQSERMGLQEVTKNLNLTNDAVVHLARNLSGEELRTVSKTLSKIHQGDALSRDEAVQVAKFLEDASAKGLLNFHLTKPENLQKIKESGVMYSAVYKMRIFAMSSRTEAGQYFKMGAVKGFGEGEVIFQGEAAKLFKTPAPKGPVSGLHRLAGHQVTAPGKLIIEEAEMREGVLFIKKAHMKPLEKMEKFKPLADLVLDGLGGPVFLVLPSNILPYRYESMEQKK